ncbi:MAG: cbb3-type cytochrome c oxidase subunit I [Proteobacteria bacterium]|nr:cbb3-type cytochrome c oxidase subunit I [Pseudomonadota bacterium]
MSGSKGGIGKFLREWIFTIDHKRVGILYLIGSLAAFAVAGLMAMLMRIELSSVGPTITDPNTYNVWLYFHGAAMILGFQIPALTGFFANWLIPLQIGAKDVAFPRLNALSLWLFWMGIVLALLTFVVPNPPDIMWTAYPPYSILSPGNTAFYSFTVLIMGFASIAGGVNLITTIIYMRAPGMRWGKLNMFVWCTMAAFILQLIFVPILGTAVTMISMDKYLGTTFFSPTSGGDVLLYQNLFWFYSHPAVYVILLPVLGIIFDIVATFARNRIFNYKVAVYGGVGGILLVSGEVWIHHLYASGMPNWIRIGMMMSTLLISVPVGLCVLSIIGTLYRGAIEFKTPMLYAVGFIFLFLIGGLTGIPLALAALDIFIHDTHFIVAHFHYVMAVAGTFSIIGGIYYYWPKFTGKMYNETLGKIGFVITFIGVNITFFAMFFVGLEGMPRRYFDYAQMPQLEDGQRLVTYGAFILAVGFLIILISWLHSLFAGKPAPDNPWGSKSLEWTTTTPPGPGNWPEVPDCEDFDPYGYGE